LVGPAPNNLVRFRSLFEKNAELDVHPPSRYSARFPLGSEIGVVILLQESATSRLEALVARIWSNRCRVGGGGRGIGFWVSNMVARGYSWSCTADTCFQPLAYRSV
jgi:hypothetical protein